MSGVSQWPLPAARRSSAKAKLPPFQLGLGLINQAHTFHLDEVDFGSQPGACGNNHNAKLLFQKETEIAPSH